MRRALIYAMVGALTVPAVTLAADRTPTTTGISLGHHHRYVTVGGQVESSTGGVMTGTVTFTIRDATTGRRVGSFRRAAGGRMCALERFVHGRRVTFSTPRAGQPGETGPVDIRFQPCRMRQASGPARDRYVMVARFSGTGSYAPSVSMPVRL